MDSRGNLYSDNPEALEEALKDVPKRDNFGRLLMEKAGIQPRSEAPPDTIEVPTAVVQLNRTGRIAYHKARTKGASQKLALVAGQEAQGR